jgi:uncharacterized repeat protein (TIGR03803 family)
MEIIMKTLSRLNALLAGAAGCLSVLHGPVACAATDTVLYAFCTQPACAAGSGPDGTLLDVSGRLFGTTNVGGAYGGGTVFYASPTGGLTTIHHFGNGADGSAPIAGVIDVNGMLYGTTTSGGAYGQGTVYSIDPKTGVETVLYSFQNNGTDGVDPHAGLIDVNGMLYGTTIHGGPDDVGTVFSINPSTGAETVLFSFDFTQGADPYGGLVDVSGTLYGTTAFGGVAGGCYGYGCGTVFSLNPSTGTETVLYSFCSQANCADGTIPSGTLINVKGTLYGTAQQDGNYGGGTVFSIQPNGGSYTVLHSFGNGQDGSLPVPGLTYKNDTLYGTSIQGGTYGDGTVFSLDRKTGAETVVHSFDQNGTDGSQPYGGLIDVRGTLFGTTVYGGPYNGGTVFSMP